MLQLSDKNVDGVGFHLNWGHQMNSVYYCKVVLPALYLVLSEKQKEKKKINLGAKKHVMPHVNTCRETSRRKDKRLNAQFRKRDS